MAAGAAEVRVHGMVTESSEPTLALVDANAKGARDRRSVPEHCVPALINESLAYTGVYGTAKRTIDLIGGACAIILLSPVFAAIFVAQYLSGGFPLYRHPRVGRRGRIFDCWKFRTMVPNAEKALDELLATDRRIKEEWLRDHKLKADPRVTAFGRFLRRTSLDELPQLWNVIRGDMSLVGPRPVTPDELRRYRSKIPVYLAARPGVTGLWQVSGRNDTSYRRRVAMDVCYMRSRSIFLDVMILVRTIPAVFRSHGAY